MMDRLNGSDPAPNVASSEEWPDGAEDVPLRRARRLRSDSRRLGRRGFRRLSFAAAGFAAVLSAVVAQELAPLGPGNPLDWYALPGPAASHLPSWLGLPAPPIPAPSYGPLLQASPLGRPQRLQAAPAVELALFHPSPLGPPQPLERAPGTPLADLRPIPLGPLETLEPVLDPQDRAIAALAFIAGPLAPAQRLEVAQTHPAPILSPAPLGPVQAIQPFQGPGDPPSLAPMHPRPVGDLTPHPLAPPQPIQSAAQGSLAGPVPTETGSVRRSGNVIRKGGVVAVRAKN